MNNEEAIEALAAYLNSDEREEDARIFWDAAKRTSSTEPDLLETLKTLEGVYTDAYNVAAFVHGIACGLALHALWAPEVVEKALGLCYPNATAQRVRRECWARDRRAMARIAGTDIGPIPDSAVQSDDAFNQALFDAMRGYGVEVVTTDAEAADLADAAFEKQLEDEAAAVLDRARLDDNIGIREFFDLCDHWLGEFEPDPDPGGWDRWAADLADAAFEKQLEDEADAALDRALFRALFDDSVGLDAFLDLCVRRLGKFEPDPDPGGWDRWAADLARSP